MVPRNCINPAGRMEDFPALERNALLEGYAWAFKPAYYRSSCNQDGNFESSWTCAFCGRDYQGKEYYGSLTFVCDCWAFFVENGPHFTWMADITTEDEANRINAIRWQ